MLGDALNNGTLAALLATEDGHYIAVSDEASRLTGYTRTELTRLRTGQMGADAESQAIYEAIMYRRELEGVKTLRHRAGEIIRCRYWAVPTKVAGVAHFILILRPEIPSSTATATA